MIVFVLNKKISFDFKKKKKECNDEKLIEIFTVHVKPRFFFLLVAVNAT